MKGFAALHSRRSLCMMDIEWKEDSAHHSCSLKVMGILWSNKPWKFETVIYPQEGKVNICPVFFKTYYQKLKRHGYGWIIDELGRNSRITFGRTENDNYLLPGKSIANDFALYKPTAIILTYLGRGNRFKMKILSKRVPGRWEEDIKEEAMSTSSDAEEKEKEFDKDQCLVWKMPITEAFAAAENVQVMHFPNKISKHIIPKDQKRMLLVDVDTKKKYKCRLITSNRYRYEKYLGGEWYQFVKDCKLGEGDALVFEFEKVPLKLSVMVVHPNHQRWVF